jgi:hypothetical protein
MRKSHISRALVTALSCAVIFPTASVFSQVLDGVPHLISYQGRLTDADGNPVPDGEYLITFRIWSDPTST